MRSRHPSAPPPAALPARSLPAARAPLLKQAIGRVEGKLPAVPEHDCRAGFMADGQGHGAHGGEYHASQRLVEGLRRSGDGVVAEYEQVGTPVC
jgi:hypothetical protein